MTKEQNSIILIGVFCLVLVIAGFWLAGTPVSQKYIRYDEKRLNDFSDIRFQIEGYYQKNKKLPEALDNLPNVRNMIDPETSSNYEYNKITDTKYNLCTTFSNDYKEFIAQGGNQYYFGADQQLNYKKGQSCIPLELPEHVVTPNPPVDPVSIPVTSPREIYTAPAIETTAPVLRED